jgi:hypothetical protein
MNASCGVPEYAAILERLASGLAPLQCRLFGGAAIGHANRLTERPRDLDVAVEGGVAELDAATRAIRSGGFPCGERVRIYRMNHRRCCWIVGAQADTWDVDLSFVASFGDIGQFTVDSVQLALPGLEVLDPHHGRVAFARRRLEIVGPIESQSPYLLLNRLLSVAAKYRFRFGRRSPNRDTAERLEGRFRAYAPDERVLYAREDVAGFASTFVRAMLRTPRVAELLGDMLDSGLLARAAPDLAGLCERRMSSLARSPGPRSPSELVRWLVGSRRRAERTARLASALRPLELRRWNAVDQAVLTALSETSRLPGR